MIAKKTSWNKDQFLFCGAAMAVNLSKLVNLSGLKYGEALSEIFCVFGFEKTL